MSPTMMPRLGRFLAAHMDILFYTQDQGGTRERKIIRVEFSFDGMFHIHWYPLINFYRLIFRCFYDA